MAIKKKYLVEKRNVLNELRSNNMTLQELRFFSIYLAKINARDISTRAVRFPIADFQKIMDMNTVNIVQLQNTTDSLLRKIVSVPLESGGFNKFQLFKKCRFDKEENGAWFIEIDAHDDALPLMFNFKDRYFTYELWNALRLKSANQLRMYELLKQYEKLGERVISVVELKELLGLGKDEYPRYNNFKSKVIDVCRDALETYTDIKFVCEPTGKLGKGGKVLNLKFTVLRNDNYADPLSLSDFIDVRSNQADKYDGETEAEDDRIRFLAEACDGEFAEAEIKVLYNLIVQILAHKIGETVSGFQLRAYDYLHHRYDELNWRAGQREIRNRFGYIKKMLEADVQANQE